MSIAVKDPVAPKRPEPRSIQILDDQTVNQIAAGEVVERPASVVKELVENSIDAGSSTITVVLEGGGQRRIEVLDDGCGMGEADAKLALQRFGTSKIRAAEDLLQISTLGFRGEALPSIASVSRLSLQSAVHGETIGTLLDVNAGTLERIEAVAMPAGTRVIVNELFGNVPARKKFLRTPKTEIGVVKSLIIDFALSHPERRFKLVSDGETVLNLAPEPDFSSRVQSAKVAGSDSLPIEGSIPTEQGRYTLIGRLSKPRDAVAGSSRLRLIVNGRSVRDRVLLKAVRDSYGNYLRGDRYPFGVLCLEVPPSELDVNVHPQKSEVRFRHTDVVFRIIRGSIARAFDHANIASAAVTEGTGGIGGTTSPFPSYGAPTTIPFSPRFPMATRVDPLSRLYAPEPEFVSGSDDSAAQSSAFRSGVSGGGIEFDSRVVEVPSKDSLRYIDQIFGCYLLFEDGENFVILDMHAAHERVTFARMKRQLLESGSLKEQLLLIPETVQVTGSCDLAPEELVPLLGKLGFEAEPLRDGALLVRSVPALLSSRSARELLEDLFNDNGALGVSSEIEKRLDYAVARLACHGSVRSGKEMERDEVYALLDQMQSTELAAFCPHGRPVMVTLTEREIEAMFGRV